MGLTVTNKNPSKAPVSPGAQKFSAIDVDYDSSYLTGGESLTAANFGLQRLDLVVATPKSGFLFEYDYTNATLLARDKPWSNTPIAFKDADGAAAAGVSVYVHVDEVLEQGTQLAHLEFVSPTNADGTGTTISGGQTYYIQDDDNAATGGFALYYDEDATLGSRLLANTGRDCWVIIGGGRAIKVTHNATPATPGVLVYFDEDAANSYDRLQFVSPTDTNGTETSSSEVNSTTNLSGLTGVRVGAWGI